MSTTSVDQQTTSGSWFRSLGADGRRAFVGASGGWALDAYDYQVLLLGLAAITVYFHINSGQAGLLSTVTLLTSGLGGALAGVLADRIGRVRTLMFTVATYALFTVLCGFAPSYPALMVLRGLQGIGFGGEWAIGAVLVAEYASPRFRGRTLGFVQSSWAVGWALAVLVNTLVFTLSSPSMAWRILFWTGALPAVLVVYLRRSVTDAPAKQSTRDRGSLAAILRGRLGRTTFFAALLATGVQGGYYTLFTWLPTYLKTARHLSVVGTGGYLTFLISGAFLGYLTGGYVTDRLGRRRTFALFAVLSAVLIVGYTHIPAGANTALLILGFPLGFTSAAIFSGFGSFLAELYPAELRGTGQGFTYNVGRAVGAFFPTAVGFQAIGVGIGPALSYGALGYGVAVVALLGLPETVGRELI
jgi:MFS family permease